ncbi:uncharacterized protein LOC143028603 [Oratosquilla oratoria]|uniref:uncharacterized protein LOC143028603 n=1 Tax=Oratosquilla oratoria TaxID=337810 RepID=UPI003F771158
MGCIISFFRSLRSYHGSHLTPKQLERQRRQRSQKSQKQPPREPTPPSSPEEEERHVFGRDGGSFNYNATNNPISKHPR